MEPKPPPPSDVATPKPRRKPYQKPRVQVYGDISSITQGKNSGGQNDGSGHPNKHFTS